MCKISLIYKLFISMTCSLQNQVFLCSKFCECSDWYIIRDKTMVQQLKCLFLQCDKSFSGGTTNLHQQNPFLTSGIIFVTIPYCTIYYLLYQEFLSVCAYSKILLDFWEHQLFLSLTGLTVTILFIVLTIVLNIVDSIVTCIKYFLIHQVLLII